jgi:hypothetical protein
MTTRQSIGRYLGYYVSLFGLGLGFAWVAFERAQARLARQARRHGRDSAAAQIARRRVM